MGYWFKQLSTSDIVLLKQLLKVFGQAFNEPGTYGDNVPSDAYLVSLLSKSHFIALIASKDGEVVGGLIAYELEKFEQERKEIFIYDLAVMENHRRQGIATNLITTLKSIAKKRNAYVIFVQADEGDEPAIKLYESLGTKEHTFNFDIFVKK